VRALLALQPRRPPSSQHTVTEPAPDQYWQAVPAKGEKFAGFYQLRSKAMGRQLVAAEVVHSWRPTTLRR
jgi:hypothetical protein